MESNITKTYKDYVDDVQKAFPYLTKRDVTSIIRYGWRQIYYLNLCGADTLVRSPLHNVWFLVGSLTPDSLRHFSYYKNKICIKLRIMYSRKKLKWDGYYYAGLEQEDYERLLKDSTKMGRKKRKYTFHKVKMYKLLDECKIKLYYKKYFIKFKYPVDVGFKFYKETLHCENPEIVYVRDSAAKFSDILVSNDNYEYL